MNQTTEIAPLTKTVTVNRPPAEAFRIFTEEIGTWWPVETHSLSKERAETAVLEPRVGGRIYERTQDGEELVWGDILVWEPPHRLVYSWHFGRAVRTEVEVRFAPQGEGTRVVLEHRGWERAPEKRRGYVEGWDVVLGRFITAAG